jgi:hypothetical protein
VRHDETLPPQWHRARVRSKRHSRSLRRALALALTLAIALAAAFAGGYLVASASGERGRAVLTAGTWNRLGSGVSIAVPPGWDGRVLFRDPSGLGPIFQVANFELPANEGFEPPEELPPGEEDPIKAMGPGDVLVVAITGPVNGKPAPERLSFDDLQLLPYDAPRVPRGWALAEGTFC